MMECIKEGFVLANKNLQLVFVRIAVSIINLLSFFVFLGLPLLIAILSLGFDLAQAKEMMPFFMENPAEMVTKYLGLIFFAGSALIFYIIFTSVLFLYALGGTLGVIKSSAVNMRFRFSLSSFFMEARKNFSGLMWLITLVFLAAIVLFAVFMISGAIVAVTVQAVTESGSTMEMFFSSFALMTVVVFSIIIAFAGLAFGVYSVVILIADRKRVMDTMRSTYQFLKQKPAALLYYVILVAGFLLVNMVFYGIQISLSIMPFVAPLVYIINAFFQSYLAIVLWSSLMVYYLKATGNPVYSSTYEI